MRRPEQPPRWLELLLMSLLPERDRQTVSGDLQEEFHEQVQLRGGRLGASIWYARHTVSFLPAWVGSQPKLALRLLSLCSFTALCGLWLGAMGLRFRHPGYVEGEVISAIIVGQALLTIAALCLQSVRVLLNLSSVGSVALFALATKALLGLVEGTHFEGYILLIAVALLMQGVATLLVLRDERQRPTLS